MLKGMETRPAMDIRRLPAVLHGHHRLHCFLLFLPIEKMAVISPIEQVIKSHGLSFL